MQPGFAQCKRRERELENFNTQGREREQKFHFERRDTLNIMLVSGLIYCEKGEIIGSPDMISRKRLRPSMNDA